MDAHPLRPACYAARRGLLRGSGLGRAKRIGREARLDTAQLRRVLRARVQ
jgi:hypothetical protein